MLLPGILLVPVLPLIGVAYEALAERRDRQRFDATLAVVDAVRTGTRLGPDPTALD